MSQNFQRKQISTSVFEKYNINLEYNIVDINKISKQFLLEKHTMLAYMMLLEKSEDKEQLVQNLNSIMEQEKNEKMLNKLADQITYLLSYTLEMNRKEDGKDMSTLYDRLIAENKRIIRQGKKESQKEIAKNMIYKKLDDELILETTGIEKEELGKIKKVICLAG